MTDDDNNGFSGISFSWVIVPVIVIGIAIASATWYRLRRRRRIQRATGTTHPTYAGRQRMMTPGGHWVYVHRGDRAGAARPGMGRWNPFSRSEDGLNELGEAPPAYEAKKVAGDNHELRDLESGVQPPEYPAEPPPAVTRGTQRPEMSGSLP